MTTTLFCCPICAAQLSPVGNSYLCPARHTFDIARQGYVNLLTGRAAQQHGDNKEMIAARRDFLAAGYYDALMRQVSDIACRHATQSCRILDAGCGECSYTDRIARALTEANIPHEILGMDISREALAIGGKKNKSLALAVASLYHIPLESESVDMLFEIFAPHCHEEYRRVLRTGGKLVMVIPAARHLFGLKEALYATPYENEVADTALDGFSLAEQISIRDTITLANETDLWNLFTMTPYFYRTSPQAKEQLRQKAPLTTEIAFEVLVYEKV
ncbi:MAG: methyltransferase domain-containing protein [Clostridia bacterium]|nr:methyltransferase domain-containing protein [Clostridia bacterium]